MRLNPPMIFRRSLIIALLLKSCDLISVWKKVNAMKWLFIYHRDFVLCYVYLSLLHFVISFKYDFHVDAGRTIVKTREM